MCIYCLLTGIGHDEEVDIERLPDPIPRGVFKQVIPHGPPTYIVADLETTDLIRGDQIPHITQIAAVEMSTGSTFNKYVIPKIPITSAAENVTKIIMVNEKVMAVDGVTVEPVPLHVALKKFLSWLESFDNIYIIAHNGRRFDFIVLTAAYKVCGLLPNFLSAITGLVDSLPVFKHVYPNRTSYKQEDLARDLLCKGYNAHNAEADVKCLSELVSLMVSTQNDCMIVKSFPPIDIKFNMDCNKEKKKNFPTLEVLIAAGVMKNATADNIASSGLNFEHLKTIFRRKGEDGLLNVFTAKNSEGQPRVTNAKRTLESVVPKLAAYFEKNC
ncbi:uncharacterized protein LOC132747499 [Ruditapes philippinarum]|uniref:uncharacterized protein LOC132747499 n=1 Tax=Ruditapes philippinarum TaxID=129788 RepID=UPI00295B0F06|nr:uncharacterized protein LOC132747499 [Ruditapes philippinarum]